MSKKKTHEEFVNEVYNLVKDEYTVIDKYIGTNTKIKIKHNKCNKEYLVTPNKFLHGRRCPYCKGERISNANSKTHEEFINEVYNLVKDEYTILGTYKNSETKIKVRHNKCKNEYLVRPREFLQGNRCPKCAQYIRKSKTTKNHEEFVNEVYKLHGNEYTVLEEYINNKTKIKIHHNKCNKDFKIAPMYFIRGIRCPYCFGNILKTTEEFKNEVYTLVKDEYIVLGEYINSDTKIKIRHNKCNTEYLVTPNKFLQGRRCPYCNLHNNSSKNEILIENYLIKNSIKYEREKKFNSCKDKRLLRFDFYLPEYDLLIEYDGSQHDNTSWYKDINKLKLTQKHDQIKNKWCKENDKNLLRINYKQDTISVLDNYLNENYNFNK